MNIVDVVLFNARTMPDKVAIAVRNRGVTYARLAAAVCNAADNIRAANLKPGELVGIGRENLIRHLTLVLALYRCGIPSVSLPQGIDFARTSLRLAAVLRDKDAAPVSGAPNIVIDGSWFEPKSSVTSAAAHSGFQRRDALCRVSLSSGTTGYPKAIGFTVADIETRVLTYLLRASGPAWNCMMCLPGPSTNFGFIHALVALTQGRSLVTAQPTEEALAMIPQYAVDLAIVSTHQLRHLVQAQTAEPVALGSLRAVFVSGNVMSQSFFEEARTRICRHIVCTYGSTEAGAVAHAKSEFLNGTEGAVGFVVPWAEVETVDDRGSVLPRGEIGIIRIRAEGQGHSYAAKSSETDSDFRDGWFYPGDRGMVTKHGMMAIVGRTRELINAGGVKVAPELIEESLLTRPDVTDAAALSMVGASGTEELWLAVVPNGTPPSASEIATYCAQKNRDCYPTRVKFVSSIPRTALGKVARNQLRQIVTR